MVSARREPPDAPPPHTAGPNQLNYSSRVPSASHRPQPRLSVCTAASERASEAYLSVRSHHGITGVVGRWLRVRGGLRPGRTLEKRARRASVAC